MKKLYSALLVILTCILLVTGCNFNKSNDTKNQQTGTDTDKKTEIVLEETDYDADCVKKKGNRYVIVLPISKHTIPVSNSYVKYLSRVSDELVLAAEQKITDQVKALGEELSWKIQSSEDSEMCIAVEVAVEIAGATDEGCGIDHEHILFVESIIVNE